MSIVTTPTLPSCCPTCGKVIDAATGMLCAARPTPGDISVCWNCGELMVFLHDLTLGLADAAHLARYDVTTQRAILWSQKAIRKRGKLWRGPGQ